MQDSALFTAAVAIAAGMTAQIAALRFRVPAIVFLLAAGVTIGPDGFGLLDPKVLGPARADLVGLAVTVILFEGALGLRRDVLRHQQRSLALLLTVGGLISMIVGTAAARYLLGMSWSTASLYGSLMIVTGPTVVTPLLARLSVDRPVRELLVSEGVLIDPLGAIVAIVALEYILGWQDALSSGWLVVSRLAIGGCIGAAVGFAVARILQARWVAEELWNPTVLASVLLAATLASRFSAEAGLMTAVMQGVVMANAGVREVRRLQGFNEEVTVVLLSFIFVVLAAGLPLSAVRSLGWPGLAVVALLIWVARPLAVLLCTAGSSLTWRQRVFIAWICPRGIVAASVAGLFHILLNDAGIPGGEQLEALVFVTVGITVSLQGLTAERLTRWLRIDARTIAGTMIIGADRLGRLLAGLLSKAGAQVVVVDRNRDLCRQAQEEGLTIYSGDALSADALEEAGAHYVEVLIALTENTELNALVAARARELFRVRRILNVADESTRLERAGAAHPFPGQFPGAAEANALLHAGRVRLAAYQVPREAADRRLAELPYGEGEFAIVLVRHGGASIAASDQRLAADDRIVAVRPLGSNSGLAAELALVSEANADEAGSLLEASA